ncbi:MAG: AraC family transcriptional regulator, partial [Bacteroidota bacterium]
FQYVMNHYHQPIQLEAVAQLTNSSVSSFCRNFKLRTQKTFVQFVNEIRVGAACKLLRERNRDIAAIAWEVGFNNISNFNRQFKRVTGFTPSQYRRKF